MSKSDYTSDEKDSKLDRSSRVENIRKIFNEYPVQFSIFIGICIGYVIDIVFVLDVFYNNPILTYIVMPTIIVSSLFVMYIGYTKNSKLIRFLESFFIGNMYYFVIKAFSLIMLFVNDYITNYEYVHTYTYITPYWLVFSIVRSLGLSGFFALLEKGLSFGQKYVTIEENDSRH